MGERVILLELNELNFDFVSKYVARGALPNFGALLKDNKLELTTSESKYELLEPWIQWVTAHTGKTFDEHGVFRLGDIVDHDVEQIWEFLERSGVSVGAISPMNAKNRTKTAAFFVPDPWTKTAVTGSPLLAKLSAALSQAVNDNAAARLGPSSAFWLAMGMLRFARIKSYPHYARYLLGTLTTRPWSKAQVLEELLSNLTVKLTQKKQPGFVSIFLNAGAHIQHHYMFNSKVYEGIQRNPEWLISEEADPIFDIYSQYDRVIGDLRSSLPEYRLIVATGLHQDPYPEETYYWRLKNHGSFLDLLGVPYVSIEPRMSRDFLVHCGSIESAANAAGMLERVASQSGDKLFEIDNRGESLFVTLVYASDISPTMSVASGNRVIPDFRQHTAFVAIKNGEHNGIGYLIDTGAHESVQQNLPLAHLPQRIAGAFGLTWAQQGSS